VAKLFAKHIKIKDAIKFLKNTRTGMAVGTPTRLNDLMEEGTWREISFAEKPSTERHLGALAVDKLERIIVDASHIDQKKRGVLEMRETLIPLTQWLNRKEFKDRYGQHGSGIDLLFY
jgi:protein CMS1